MNWFWKRFAKWQQKRDKGNKPDLIYAFTDSEGNRYYTWQVDEMLPTCRLQALENIMMHYELHLTPQQIEGIAKAIQHGTADIIKAKDDKSRSEAAAKVNVYANQILTRQQYCVPVELYIEMAALYAVRHDERSGEISKVIQDEKILQFKKDIDSGIDFFFLIPLLVKSTNLSTMSKEQSRRYFQKSAMEQLSEKKVMEYLSSK